MRIFLYSQETHLCFALNGGLTVVLQAATKQYMYQKCDTLVYKSYPSKFVVLSKGNFVEKTKYAILNLMKITKWKPDLINGPFSQIFCHCSYILVLPFLTP